MAASAHIWFPGLWAGGSWGWAGLRCLHLPGHLLCQHPSQVGLALAWAWWVLMAPRPRPGGPRWGSCARGCIGLSRQGRLPLPTRSGALLVGGPWQSDTSQQRADPSASSSPQSSDAPHPTAPCQQLPPQHCPRLKGQFSSHSIGQQRGWGWMQKQRQEQGFCLHDGNTLRLL